MIGYFDIPEGSRGNPLDHLLAMRREARKLYRSSPETYASAFVAFVITNLPIAAFVTSPSSSKEETRISFRRYDLPKEVELLYGRKGALYVNVFAKWAENGVEVLRYVVGRKSEFEEMARTCRETR